MTPLDEHIMACLSQTGLVIGHSGGHAFTALREAIAADPDMQSAARRMIDNGKAVEQRDHIARWRSALLRRALGESPNV